MKNEALKLIERGFRITPCQGKNPFLDGWQHRPITKKELVETYWKNEYNIAIVTGNGIVVIDCDMKPDKGINGLENFINFLKENEIELPDTLTATTGGGGKHFYFSTTQYIRSRVGFLGIKGIDVRASGGCAIAPPSMHESGNRYTWNNNNQILPLPPKLEDILVNYDKYKKELTRKEKETNGKKEKVAKEKKGVSFKDEYRSKEIIPVGERNDTLFRAGSLMAAMGFDPYTIKAALESENELKCDPPLSTDEVERIALSIEHYCGDEYCYANTSILYSGKITPIAIAIYSYLRHITISKHVTKDVVYASQEEIGKSIGVKSTSIVRKHVKILEDAGLIKSALVPNYNGGHRMYSYSIL